MEDFNFEDSQRTQTQMDNSIHQENNEVSSKKKHTRQDHLADVLGILQNGADDAVNKCIEHIQTVIAKRRKREQHKGNTANGVVGIGTAKKHRTKSAYNIYIGKQVAHFKAKCPDIPPRDRLNTAIARWTALGAYDKAQYMSAHTHAHDS
jgi:hypothetical protein